VPALRYRARPQGGQRERPQLALEAVQMVGVTHLGGDELHLRAFDDIIATRR
jgi:hypothetical protein